MPRIQMTRTVRFALIFIRIYLIVLLSLIALKFVRVFGGAEQKPTPPAAPAKAAGEQVGK